MKIAVTGCNGRIGRRVVTKALKQGHTIVGIDTVQPPTGFDHADNQQFSFLQIDLRDYDETYKALQGCEAVVALAAIPNPTDYISITHNTYGDSCAGGILVFDQISNRNVVISWNVLRAAAEVGDPIHSNLFMVMILSLPPSTVLPALPKHHR